MNPLREYIRELLTEAAKGPTDIPGRIVVQIIEDDLSAQIFYAKPIKKQGSRYVYGRSERPRGIIEIFKPESIKDDGPCAGAWQVAHSIASDGWGPMLYDIAMEWATLNGGGLVSDRVIVSRDARGVWDYYMANRGDTTGIQMDDLKNSLTPEDEDNCNQQAAGSTSVGAFGGENAEKQEWVDSPLSKRWTKPPTTIAALKKLGKLVHV